MLSCASSHVLRKFPSSFRSLAVLEHAHAACGYVGRSQPENLSPSNFDIKTEPVGAEHAARGIKRHRSSDEALELRPGADQQALPDVLCPGHAADQRII